MLFFSNPASVRLLPIAAAARLMVSGLMLASVCDAIAADAASDAESREKTLGAIEVTANADASAEGLPKPFAGNQVARGGRVGLLGNQVDLLITAAPTAVPQVQGGKVRALAITGDKQLPALPGVPTFKEVGLPGYKVSNWFGLAAPKGTPKDIVERMQAEVAKAMGDAKLLEKFNAMGARPGGLPSAEFSSFLKSEIQMWSEVSKSAGVKPE